MMLRKGMVLRNLVLRNLVPSKPGAKHMPRRETITTLSNGLTKRSEVSPRKEASAFPWCYFALGAVIEFVGGLTWSVIWVYGSLKITVIWV
jgi:hypothetical protein